MPVVLRQGPDLLALSVITRKLRAADRDECFSLSWDDSPDTLAQRTYQAGPFQWIAWLDGAPVASIGAHANWPGVWTCWAFGTDQWNKAALTLTKHVRRVMMPALYASDVNRLQCHAMAEHTRARAWLRMLGANEGEPLDFYGKSGQTYHCYWWDRRTVRDNPKLRRHLPANSVRPVQT